MKRTYLTLLALIIGLSAPAIGFSADGDQNGGKKEGTKQEAEPDCD